MQCKVEGCQNRTWAVNGLCLECAAKVWWLAHRKPSDGQAERKQVVRK